MSKHTPGPWRADLPDGWGGAFIETTQPQADGRTALICSLYERQSAFPPDDDEMQANACLIAAAPDLLEALKVALQAIDDCHKWRSHNHDPAEAQIRAAIAKAEGKS